MIIHFESKSEEMGQMFKNC